jgi:hypothetical protein
MKTPTRAEAEYVKAYGRARLAMEAVQNMIYSNPAPEGEIEIHWGHVGDMIRIAAELEAILPED